MTSIAKELSRPGVRVQPEIIDEAAALFNKLEAAFAAELVGASPQDARVLANYKSRAGDACKFLAAEKDRFRGLCARGGSIENRFERDSIGARLGMVLDILTLFREASGWSSSDFPELQPVKLILSAGDRPQQLDTVYGRMASALEAFGFRVR